jgi:tetratricopeptide (TPR) repeat protein
MMNPADQSHGFQRISALLLLCFLFPIMPYALPEAPYEGPAPAQIEKMRSMAESQHEIVLLLVKKKDFEQALGEAAKIFQMPWPPDQEPLLLKDLLLIADQFHHAGQAAASIRLIDSNLKYFKTPSNLSSIWKEKGYLYKTLGESDKALECFRQAQKLEK